MWDLQAANRNAVYAWQLGVLTAQARSTVHIRPHAPRNTLLHTPPVYGYHTNMQCRGQASARSTAHLKAFASWKPVIVEQCMAGKGSVIFLLWVQRVCHFVII